jgi:hypothetical protein
MNASPKESLASAAMAGFMESRKNENENRVSGMKIDFRRSSSMVLNGENFHRDEVCLQLTAE